VTTATLLVFGLSAVTVLLGWGYFRRYQVSRPPIGVMSLGDVVVLMSGIILIPYLYLALPGWLVGAILGLSTLGILQLLLEPVLPGRWSSWLVAAALMIADVGLALRAGVTSPGYLALNDMVLILAVVGVTNLWAQSGLKARDLAILAGMLTLYDLVATSLLPLTTELIQRLAGLPFTPLLAWPVDGRDWLGIGLGDLLLATVGPLVLRKAFGTTAGVVALVIALAAIGGVMILPLTGWLRGTFPVMVVLGPLLVAQYAYWIRRHGVERTTAAYLLADRPASLLAPSRRVAEPAEPLSAP
jgi:hypothetical protein